MRIEPLTRIHCNFTFTSLVALVHQRRQRKDTRLRIDDSITM